MVTLVRRRGAFGHVVVTRNSQHATKRCGASHIGVLEHIGATVNARAFAIPNAKHAVKALRACWRKAQLLRTPQGSSRQLLVDARLKHNVVGRQMRLGLEQGLVIGAQR